MDHTWAQILQFYFPVASNYGVERESYKEPRSAKHIDATQSELLDPFFSSLIKRLSQPTILSPSPSPTFALSWHLSMTATGCINLRPPCQQLLMRVEQHTTQIAIGESQPDIT